jgi:hypothetical protein
MFDHLDDPEPPGPGLGTRPSVAQRARVLLVRRRLLVGGTSTAALSVVLVIALALASSGATGRSSLNYVSNPPVAVAPTPTPTPTPTPAPPVSPTPSERPTAAATHLRSPSPDASPPGEVLFGGCEVTSHAPTGPATQELVAGLTASVMIPAAVQSGAVVTADLTFHNDTDKTFFLEIYEQNSYLVQIRGAAHTWTDAIVSDRVEVPAHGEVVRHPTGAAVTDCGAAASPGPPLAAGSYDAGVALSISQIESSIASTPTPSPTRTPESLLVRRSFGSTITVT